MTKPLNYWMNEPTFEWMNECIKDKIIKQRW